MVEETTSARNHSIDLFRLIGAFAVVLLHVNYGNLPNELVLFFRWMGRWAVPFFFMVSGYFFQINYARTGDKAFLKGLQSLIMISIVANLVFLPFKIIESPGDWGNVFSIQIFTMNGHLWFINSLILGYLFLWVLLKKEKENWLIPVAIVLICFSLITNAYSLLLGLNTDLRFSMMILSLPFLIFGYLASKTRLVERKVSTFFALLMVPFGFALQTIEIIILYKFSGYSPHNQEFLLGSLFLALGMFGIALKINLNKETKLAEYGRKYSLPIYLYHPLLFSGVGALLAVLPSAGIRLWINPFLSVLMSLVVFIFLDKKFPKLFRFINGA